MDGACQVRKGVALCWDLVMHGGIGNTPEILSRGTLQHARSENRLSHAQTRTVGSSTPGRCPRLASLQLVHKVLFGSWNASYLQHAPPSLGSLCAYVTQFAAQLVG